jgi:hypothetical protein
MWRARSASPHTRIGGSASRVWIALALLIAASGCAPQPSAGYQRGELLSQVDFDQPFEWEEYVHPDLGVDFRIEDGAYRARARDGAFMWTLDTLMHTDVVIEVNTLVYSTYRDNAYGVMCRASAENNSDGYYFFISSDGHYTIRRGFNGTIQPLIEWTASAAIAQDTAPNSLRAVCLGDRLALYVNGEFVGEVRDRLYTRGNAGIAAGVPAGGDVDVAFDNLRIWAASN